MNSLLFVLIGQNGYWSSVIFDFYFRYLICDDQCEFAWHTFNLPLIFEREHKTMFCSIINVKNSLSTWKIRSWSVQQMNFSLIIVYRTININNSYRFLFTLEPQKRRVWSWRSETGVDVDALRLYQISKIISLMFGFW